jgi:hypothetical protein
MWTTLFINVAVVTGCFVGAVYVIRRDWKSYSIEISSATAALGNAGRSTRQDHQRTTASDSPKPIG